MRQQLAPVLIVEDNLETLEVLQRLLAIRGHASVTAGDGLEALTYLRGGGRAAAIVLDMRMPNMDGWALHRALRGDRRFAEIPVVIFSADPSAAGVEGVAGYVRKGTTDPDILLALIDRAVSG